MLTVDEDHTFRIQLCSYYRRPPNEFFFAGGDFPLVGMDDPYYHKNDKNNYDDNYQRKQPGIDIYLREPPYRPVFPTSVTASFLTTCNVKPSKLFMMTSSPTFTSPLSETAAQRSPL
jgi:hypothetical protein